MAPPSYRAHVLVLRKTKLGETDLIITGLNDNGSQFKAVAKGARKPSSPFSARLELFCEAEVLCAPGKSLDVIQDARLVAARNSLWASPERYAAASPAAELIDRVAQLDLESPRLFQASTVAFTTLDTAPLDAVPAVTAAHLLKTLAFAGLRPSLDRCVVCGRELHDANVTLGGFSAPEGGCICADCAAHTACTPLDADVRGWALYLLSSPYKDIERQFPTPAQAFGILRLCQGLIREHVGTRLKSLEYLFTAGFDFSEGK